MWRQRRRAWRDAIPRHPSSGQPIQAEATVPNMSGMTDVRPRRAGSRVSLVLIALGLLLIVLVGVILYVPDNKNLLAFWWIGLIGGPIMIVAALNVTFWVARARVAVEDRPSRARTAVTVAGLPVISILGSIVLSFVCFGLFSTLTYLTSLR
jgi:Na+/melibiose symporter-like transporter